MISAYVCEKFTLNSIAILNTVKVITIRLVTVVPFFLRDKSRSSIPNIYNTTLTVSTRKRLGFLLMRQTVQKFSSDHYLSDRI